MGKKKTSPTAPLEADKVIAGVAQRAQALRRLVMDVNSRKATKGWPGGLQKWTKNMGKTWENPLQMDVWMWTSWEKIWENPL